MENRTIISEFILLGFPAVLEIQLFLFVVFFLIYILTILENLIIISVVKGNRKLHKPMYFFLGNLSFLEIWYISVTLPKLLTDFWSQNKIISFQNCMSQLYFFISLMCTECVLLAVMAYDRYVAICNPLRYPVIMTHRLCFQLGLLSWVCGFSISLVKVIFISRLSFCGPGVINHFFCDISPVLNLSCTDMSVAELVDFILALVILLIPLSITVMSYLFIIISICHIPTTQGKRKAFSTCASHLTVVIIFFSTTVFMYARPRKIHPFNLNKIVSIFYAVITPALNPLIYCLRNKEVKEAIRINLGQGREASNREFSLKS
ncbi:olfactory receptor 6B1-like [Sphaerodactylus townsendi]|uniref:olfactory receptor 6B1-like n=1 Tax=Sphaerodactylus townsendi TaxID=933632 RepID=UPI0020266DF1|nr:olfactory receptor 6B1-like [Sphaerodactylus townsendi]